MASRRSTTGSATGQATNCSLTWASALLAFDRRGGRRCAARAATSSRCSAPASNVAAAEALASGWSRRSTSRSCSRRQPVAIRVSIGIAFRQPGDDDLTELMKNADLALYRAKAEGGARYLLLQSRHGRSGPEAARTGERPAQGRSTPGEFFVVYQPIVDLATGRSTAARVWSAGATRPRGCGCRPSSSTSRRNSA